MPKLCMPVVFDAIIGRYRAMMSGTLTGVPKVIQITEQVEGSSKILEFETNTINIFQTNLYERDEDVSDSKKNMIRTINK